MALVIPRTIVHQAPLSMGFSRQEYWSRLPFTSSGDLPNPGTKPTSPTLAGRFFTTEPPGKNPSPWGQELAISISLLKRGRRRTGGKKSSLALHRSGNCQDPCPPGLSLRSGFGCKCGLQSHVAWVRFWVLLLIFLDGKWYNGYKIALGLYTV